MKEVDIILPAKFDPSSVATTIQLLAKEMSLDISMKCTLKRFPGSTHWHFKRQAKPGVLEVTWWPSEESPEPSRLWISVHARRKADWVSDTIPALKRRLEIGLASQQTR